VAGPTTNCSPQLCVNAACTVGCSSTADCAPSYHCTSNVCQ
jgi:hypothetical protein